MTRYDKYLWYVIRHKWYVFVECCKAGIPIRGLMHDWHKFRLGEFIPYARHFYGKQAHKRDKTGYYKPSDTGDPDFDFAWFLHQKLGKHHWQYWTFANDNGAEPTIIVFEMPIKYRKEMLCDWKGAGKAQGTPDTKAWYNANKDKLILGPETRKWLEERL